MGVVVHICNPSHLAGRGRRTIVQDQLKQKLAKRDLKNKPDLVVYACDSSYFWRLR
jgi:hypothetical protein